MAMKAIVIGAGVAGLASAIRLAVQGFSVTVFEKNSYPGGKLSDFALKGYHFDAGPSLFVEPENIEELFELAGEPVEDYFEYSAYPVACRYFFDDGTVINAYTDKSKFAQELHHKIGENENKVLKYLQHSGKLYNDVGNIFLNYSLHKKSTLRKAPILKALATVQKKDLFDSLDGANRKSFTNQKTVQIFNRYATYNGSDPYKAPGMLSLIPHIEYGKGVYYPKGGMISITKALYQLAQEKGVHFYFNKSVDRIIYNKKTVLGVVAGEENFMAEVIVSNMDIYFTYKNLLKDERRAKKILKQERSSSAMIFYWGITKEFPGLSLHNIFFSKDYKAEFDNIFKAKTLYSDPTVYINITSKCEPAKLAPAGKENWFVMINVPANAGQDWEALKYRAKQFIIQKLNKVLETDIEPLIEVEETLDPVLIESKTYSYMGSLYGTSSNSGRAAFLRHANFSDSVNRLYFVGGSVHPGGGISLCLKSAKIMSEIVAEDKNQWKHH